MKNWEGSPNFGKIAQNQCEKPAREADWLEFERKARVVETARRLYGKRAARRLWHELGLPEVPGMPRPLPDTALLATVGAFVDTRMVRDDAGRLPAAHVYAAYSSWALATGASRLTLAMFGRLMNHTAIPKHRHRHVTYAARLVDGFPRTPLAEGSPEVVSQAKQLIPKAYSNRDTCDTIRDFATPKEGVKGQ